jgi:hypothetical protein
MKLLYLLKIVCFCLVFLGLSAWSAKAQMVNVDPLTQADIDLVVKVYGKDVPSAETELDYDQLDSIINRLAVFYLRDGQMTDKEAIIASLSILRDQAITIRSDYTLYKANEDKLKPIFFKHLGNYTLALDRGPIKVQAAVECIAPPSAAISANTEAQPIEEAGEATPAESEAQPTEPGEASSAVLEAQAGVVGEATPVDVAAQPTEAGEASPADSEAQL